MPFMPDNITETPIPRGVEIVSPDAGTVGRNRDGKFNPESIGHILAALGYGLQAADAGYHGRPMPQNPLDTILRQQIANRELAIKEDDARRKQQREALEMGMKGLEFLNKYADPSKKSQAFCQLIRETPALNNVFGSHVDFIEVTQDGIKRHDFNVGEQDSVPDPGRPGEFLPPGRYDLEGRLTGEGFIPTIAKPSAAAQKEREQQGIQERFEHGEERQTARHAETIKQRELDREQRERDRRLREQIHRETQGTLERRHRESLSVGERRHRESLAAREKKDSGPSLQDQGRIWDDAWQVESKPFTGQLGQFMNAPELGKTAKEQSDTLYKRTLDRARQVAKDRGVPGMFDNDPKDLLRRAVSEGKIKKASEAIDFLESKGLSKELATELVKGMIAAEKPEY